MQIAINAILSGMLLSGFWSNDWELRRGEGLRLWERGRLGRCTDLYWEFCFPINLDPYYPRGGSCGFVWIRRVIHLISDWKELTKFQNACMHFCYVIFTLHTSSEQWVIQQSLQSKMGHRIQSSSTWKNVYLLEQTQLPPLAHCCPFDLCICAVLQALFFIE